MTKNNPRNAQIDKHLCTAQDIAKWWKIRMKDGPWKKKLPTHEPQGKHGEDSENNHHITKTTQHYLHHFK